jgi:hypothetical protein
MDKEKPAESDTEALSGTLEPIKIPVNNPDGSARKPLLKDPKTGQWLKGTGQPNGGGRPKGAKDKITRTMIDMATSTLEEHGEAMWRQLSATDPVACLALISKLLPNADLSAAIQGAENGEDNQRLSDISIRLVSDNTKALGNDDAPRLEETGD